MGALRRLSLLGKEPQMVGDVNAAHDQHAVLLLDFADRGGRKPIFTGGYLSRLQRAPKGAG
jgi:hypothetical protein